MPRTTPPGDPALRSAVEAYLTGTPDPLGAAAVFDAVHEATPINGRPGLDVAADAWVVEHGVGFAAVAVVELLARVTPLRVFGHHQWPGWAVVARVRHALAMASDAVYLATTERLAPHRTTSRARFAIAFLVPTEQGWVNEAIDEAAVPRYAAASARWLLLAAATTMEQYERLDPLHGWTFPTRTTLLDGIGPPFAPVLASEARSSPEYSLEPLRLLATVPTDEAFRALIDLVDLPGATVAIRTAAQRFPERAVRLLAEAVATAPPTAPVHHLLRAHLIRHPDVAAAVLPTLDAETRAAGHTLIADTDRPDAPPDMLPAVLTAPPWEQQRRTRKPILVPGLVAPVVRHVAWESGEQKAWAALPAPYPYDRRSTNWRSEIVRLHEKPWHFRFQFDILAAAPVELLRPVLPGVTPEAQWRSEPDTLRRAAARLELDVLAHLLHAARLRPARLGPVLLPFCTNEVAETMADWLVRTKAGRATAKDYFARHGVVAASLLVPAALAKAAGPRHAAGAALRLAAAQQGAAAVVEAATAEYGTRAGDGIADLLATDPLDVLPARMPPIGPWVDPAGLPRLLLRDREHAVPLDRVQHVLTALSLCVPDAPYAGVEQVREACDPDSLAEFGWSLFRTWLDAGAPPKESWALTAIGAIGDDDTARRLAPLINVWPGNGHSARAAAGLDVLASIGTDIALMQLDRLSRKAKSTALKSRARDRIDAIAQDLELTPDQLADRLVPDLDLQPDGTLTLDFGPRAFVVGFDEQLQPFVTGPDGKSRKALPKPGQQDDPVLAPAAVKRFAVLKKDVRELAADQVRRLEQAMVTSRRWTGREFGDLFRSHPLLGHLTRRLVWARFDGDTAVATFRAAGHATVDVHDEPVALPVDAIVGIAHPMHLGAEITRWSVEFARHGIAAPFPQLDRPVYTLLDDGPLDRFHGAKVDIGQVLSLLRRGWLRGEPKDNGTEGWITKPVSGGRAVVLDLSPGIQVGMVHEFPDQVIHQVRLEDDAHLEWWSELPSLPIEDLDPITASELLADLAHLTR